MGCIPRANRGKMRTTISCHRDKKNFILSLCTLESIFHLSTMCILIGIAAQSLDEERGGIYALTKRELNFRLKPIFTLSFLFQMLLGARRPCDEIPRNCHSLTHAQTAEVRMARGAFFPARLKERGMNILSPSLFLSLYLYRFLFEKKSVFLCIEKNCACSEYEPASDLSI